MTSEELYRQWRERQGSTTLANHPDEPGIRRAAAADAQHIMPLDNAHLADMAHRAAQQHAQTPRDVARLERVYTRAFLEKMRQVVAAAGALNRVLPDPATGRRA